MESRYSIEAVCAPLDRLEYEWEVTVLSNIVHPCLSSIFNIQCETPLMKNGLLCDQDITICVIMDSLLCDQGMYVWNEVGRPPGAQPACRQPNVFCLKPPIIFLLFPENFPFSAVKYERKAPKAQELCEYQESFKLKNMSFIASPGKWRVWKNEKY